MPRVRIIIVNYRTPEMVALCLESLRDQRDDADIVVVDNASGDGSPEKIRETIRAAAPGVSAANAIRCFGSKPRLCRRAKNRFSSGPTCGLRCLATRRRWIRSWSLSTLAASASSGDVGRTLTT